jgi:effector-binding domain-containing protein
MKGYSRVCVIIAQYTKGSDGFDYKYIHSSSTRKQADDAIELKSLKKGTYVAYVKIDWVNNNPDKACVGVYS